MRHKFLLLLFFGSLLYSCGEVNTLENELIQDTTETNHTITIQTNDSQEVTIHIDTAGKIQVIDTL